MLVARIINKVIKYGVDIDKLLVVTFTNAAASELKSRLLDAIYLELKKNPSNVFLRQQIIALNKASINTIHSFCYDLIKSNFFLLNLDPNISICDDTRSAIFKSKAMQIVLEKMYDEYNNNSNSNSVKNNDDNALLYDVLELFKGKDEEFCDSMLRIYSYIQSFEYPLDWLKMQIEKYNILDDDVDLYTLDFGKNIYDDCIQRLRIIDKKILDIIQKTKSKDALEFEKYIECLESDEAKISKCYTSSNSNWDLLYSNLSEVNFVRFPSKKVVDEQYRENLKKSREYIKEIVKDLKQRVYEPSKQILLELKKMYPYLIYIYNFLKDFDKEYVILKTQQNVIDFNDIEHLALNLLVDKDTHEYTKVAKALQEKYLEVYTDEYQDTSFIQEAILNAVSGKKNRFMVGDIKQSIYKFRQAMPEIFNQKYEKYQNIDSDNNLNDESEYNKEYRIILSQNFRSRKNIIDSVNSIFSKIMNKQIGECDYSDNEELVYGSNYPENIENDYSTEINVIDLKNEELENEESQDDYIQTAKEYIQDLEKFEIESINIAKRIKELVGKFKVSRFDKKTGSYNFENAKYKDIVILLRNIKDKGLILEKTLKEYGIPAFCDAGSSLFDSDEIKIVMSFLKIVDNQLQDIPLVAVMYSVIGKFSLDEITKIRMYAPSDYLYNALIASSKDENLEDNIKQKVNDFLKLLNTFKSYANIYSIPDMLAKLYKETDIYEQFGMLKNSKEIKANLDALMQIAVKYDENMEHSIYSYISYIDELKDKKSSDTSSAKILGENEDVVRIMTIHKSKGLEFPIVILANAAVKYNKRDTSSEIVMHHNLGIGINCVDSEYKVTYPSVIKQSISMAMQAENKSEELRVLYVALTRAKEKLIIFGSILDYSKLDSSLYVMYDKENKIDSIISSNCDSFLKVILLAIKSLPKDNKIFKVSVINVYEKKNLEKISKQITENNMASGLKTIDAKINLIEQEVTALSNSEEALYINEYEPNINKYYKMCEDKFNLKYKYLNDVKTKTRVSVSELKKQAMEDEIDKTNNSENIFKIKQEYKMKKPECITSDIMHYSGSRKGTLVHFVLEHLDFSIDSKEKLNEYINNMIVNNVITKEDAKQIDINIIYNFLCSDIVEELRNIDKNDIYREQEFILKDETYSNSYIQGVIDLYYINSNNNITLVDFKTDKVYSEQEFLKRYKKQLEIYKSALEKLKNIKVENTYIYSFSLNRKIEVI